MPPTNSPTLRQRRLGAELRKLRERAGLTATGAAEVLGVNQARVSMIETGRTPISADRLRSMARAYACSDEELVDALASMTGRRTRGWWDSYRDHLPVGFIDLAELEYHAVAVRVALVVHIPALLQTTDHARALFNEAVPALRQYEIEHRVSHRIKRQEILHRDNPPSYTAVIHECALHMEYGGAATVRAQLKHLLDMSELEHVTVKVMPFGYGSFPGNGQSVDYLAGPVPQLDTVQLDTHHGCEFLDAEAQLEKYRLVINRMEENALEPAESRDLIHRIAKTV
ncbi:helix-turn-helix transcriptional regulator [Streptomyces sp. CoH27]|uniref:helix-turn-helix domain-containing protein n=1 Tax=Streptomyces sp. CoH27 TaxID=2875763 RepID=UPI001CD35514|nr:helix-turn-helix transcriptional regulator [Streptomyces sp. CoH27]